MDRTVHWGTAAFHGGLVAVLLVGCGEEAPPTLPAPHTVEQRPEVVVPDPGPTRVNGDSEDALPPSDDSSEQPLAGRWVIASVQPGATCLVLGEDGSFTFATAIDASERRHEVQGTYEMDSMSSALTFLPAQIVMTHYDLPERCGAPLQVPPGQSVAVARVGALHFEVGTRTTTRIERAGEELRLCEGDACTRVRRPLPPPQPDPRDPDEYERSSECPGPTERRHQTDMATESIGPVRIGRWVPRRHDLSTVWAGPFLLVLGDDEVQAVFALADHLGSIRWVESDEGIRLDEAGLRDFAPAGTGSVGVFRFFSPIVDARARALASLPAFRGEPHRGRAGYIDLSSLGNGPSALLFLAPHGRHGDYTTYLRYGLRAFERCGLLPTPAE